MFSHNQKEMSCNSVLARKKYLHQRILRRKWHFPLILAEEGLSTTLCRAVNRVVRRTTPPPSKREAGVLGWMAVSASTTLQNRVFSTFYTLEKLFTDINCRPIGDTEVSKGRGVIIKEGGHRVGFRFKVEELVLGRNIEEVRSEALDEGDLRRGG